MFICPDCRTRLVRTKNENAVFWVCATCGGKAVTVPVLRKTVIREYVNRLWASALGRDGSQTAPSARRCPACDQQMTAVRVPATPAATTVDVCRSCAFIWFDPREFENAPPLPPASRPEESLPLEERRALALGKVLAAGPIPDPGPTDWWQYIPALLGLPVEEDVNQLQRLPFITWTLAAAMVLLTAQVYSDPQKAMESFGLLPAHPLRDGGLTLFTSFFLHGGRIHLATNVYFLCLFGDNVEDSLGRPRYVLLLVFAALTGDIVHVVLSPHSQAPCVGPSAAVSAIIAYYALQFPHAQLGYFTRFSLRWMRMPAYALLTTWVILQIVGAWQDFRGFSGISTLAQLAGAAIGAGFWFWLGGYAIAAPPADH